MTVKRLTLSGITFIFAVYLTLATAYAQVASSSSQTAATTQIDYQLPYPGMFPDNPLYFLKVFRDQLTAFFLSKPLDKAQFDLMQSDKNVEAGYLLGTQQVGKSDLAIATISSGEDDFSSAIDQTEAAKKQGYSILEMSKKLDLSNQKHMQVIKEIEGQVGKAQSQELKNELNRAEAFAKKINALR